jgi:hypothetical protein
VVIGTIGSGRVRGRRRIRADQRVPKQGLLAAADLQAERKRCGQAVADEVVVAGQVAEAAAAGRGLDDPGGRDG